VFWLKVWALAISLLGVMFFIHLSSYDSRVFVGGVNGFSYSEKGVFISVVNSTSSESFWCEGDCGGVNYLFGRDVVVFYSFESEDFLVVNKIVELQGG